MGYQFMRIFFLLVAVFKIVNYRNSKWRRFFGNRSRIDFVIQTRISTRNVELWSNSFVIEHARPSSFETKQRNSFFKKIFQIFFSLLNRVYGKLYGKNYYKKYMENSE